MLCRRSIDASVLAGLLCCAASGGPATDERSPSVQVLDERKLESLEQRLSAKGGGGFRFLGALAGDAGLTRSNEIRVYLGRDGATDRLADYRVVSGPFSGALERLVNRTAQAGGFRVARDGVLRRAKPHPLGNPRTPAAETVALIMERDGSGPTYEYTLLTPGTPRQFTRETEQRFRSGFILRAVRAFDGGFTLAVMERPVVEQRHTPPAEGAPPQYIVIDDRKREQMFDAVGKAAAAGYRVFATVHDGFAGGGSAVIMERATVRGRPYSYFFLGSPSPSELESRLTEGAAAGYRFIAGLAAQGELLMERAPFDEVDVDYLVVTAEAAALIEERLARAIADGWSWAGLFGEAVVLARDRATSGSR
ncbi:MAG TPA: hypothetical protein VD788_06515 [Candidatus Polarisedimenticolaceae bacterium]|nr:hypothetical protein [Candidatus Polarisedimenticolaceae bacterium]